MNTHFLTNLFKRWASYSMPAVFIVLIVMAVLLVLFVIFEDDLLPLHGLNLNGKNIDEN